MRTLSKRLDQVQLRKLPFPLSVFFRAYQSGRITQDEYHWISKSTIDFSAIMWGEYDPSPDAIRYKDILDKSGYLPPVEWME